MNWRIITLGIALIALALYGTSVFDVGKSASGNAIVKIVVPVLGSNLRAGETAFNQNCAACHGANAAGKTGTAPPLVHKIYEPSHHGDIAFILAAKQGVRQHHWRFGNMPPLPGVGEQEIAAIIDYVRTLQRANGIY